MAAHPLDPHYKKIGFITLISACGGPSAQPCQSPSPSDDGQVAAVLTTLTSSYDAGSLSLVNLTNYSVCNDVTIATGDAVVTVEGHTVVQINRYLHDTVRLYDAGSWSAPTLEYDVGTAANPHDAAYCAGNWFLSLYGRDALDVRDDSGTRIGGVDLSAFADEDGLPEASELEVQGDRLFVALQRLDRHDGFAAHEQGTIVEVDCTSRTVTKSWPAPPNTRLSRAPGGVMWVYGDAPTLLTVDRERDVLTPTGVQLPAHPSTLAWSADAAVVITRDDSGSHDVHCLDADRRLTHLLTTGAFLPSAKADQYGDVWIAARQGWADVHADQGLYVVDPVSCALQSNTPIQTHLAPYSVAFF